MKLFGYKIKFKVVEKKHYVQFCANISNFQSHDVKGRTQSFILFVIQNNSDPQAPVLPYGCYGRGMLQNLCCLFGHFLHVCSACL